MNALIINIAVHAIIYRLIRTGRSVKNMGSTIMKAMYFTASIFGFNIVLKTML